MSKKLLEAGKAYKTSGGYDVFVDFVDEKRNSATGRILVKGNNKWTGLDWSAGGEYMKSYPEKSSPLDIIFEPAPPVKTKLSLFVEESGEVVCCSTGESSSGILSEHLRDNHPTLTKIDFEVSVAPETMETTFTCLKTWERLGEPSKQS